MLVMATRTDDELLAIMRRTLETGAHPDEGLAATDELMRRIVVGEAGLSDEDIDQLELGLLRAAALRGGVKRLPPPHAAEG